VLNRLCAIPHRPPKLETGDASGRRQPTGRLSGSTLLSNASLGHSNNHSFAYSQRFTCISRGSLIFQQFNWLLTDNGNANRYGNSNSAASARRGIQRALTDNGNGNRKRNSKSAYRRRQRQQERALTDNPREDEFKQRLPTTPTPAGRGIQATVQRQQEQEFRNDRNDSIYSNSNNSRRML
jgi:hypothetical protein